MINITIDVFDPIGNTHSARKFTNSEIGNWWCELAKGCRTVCFPIWLYCDDTSGNLLKSGMSTTASCSPLLDFLAARSRKNIIFIFCQLQILPHRSK
jgi:hypothetical protein